MDYNEYNGYDDIFTMITGIDSTYYLLYCFGRTYNSS